MSILDLFFADDGVHGQQLYSTNGGVVTALTTFPSDGSPPGPLTIVDGVGYFLGPDGNGQFGPQDQLWRSDGTAAGTFAIGLSGDSGPPQIAQIGNTVFYIGQDATHREALFTSVGGQPGQFLSELGQNPNLTFALNFLGTVGNQLILELQGSAWISDGTAAGTHLLSDGESSPAIQNANPPVLFNGAGYMAGSDANNVFQLFKIAGSTASVVSSSIVGTGVGELVALPGHLVYTVAGGNLESWDGVASSHTELFQNLQFANVDYFHLGDRLYFEAADQANPNSPTGLYVTDGTVAGTHQVASGGFDAVVDLGARVVMEGNGTGFDVSDGTVAGTTQVIGQGHTFFGLTKVGDKAYFVADGSQLWVTDGTVAGTHELANFSGIGSTFTAVGEQVTFFADQDGSNFEPWVSDGTVAGTHVIANIHAPNPGNLGVADETAFGSGIAFLGTPPTAGAGIWVSDGTVAGTGEILTSFNAPPFIPGPPVAAGGKLFFIADTGNGSDLMVSSGKPGTTATDLGSHAAQFMMAFDNKLYFYDSSQGPGGEFFVSDGTASGTTEVAAATMLTQPVVLGSDLVFLGVGSGSQIEVFKSDGTSAGTTSSLIAGAGSTTQTATSMTVSGSKAFFVAQTAAVGAELWVTDGTSAGTALVKDINPGAGDSNPSSITAFDGGVIFNTTSGGGQIWFSNGTAAGTFQLNVNQTHDPSASLQASSAVSFDGKAFFVANDGIDGDQLWASNGTAVGTSVVAQLAPNATSESAFGFVSLGSKLFFADQGNAWVTDGTAAGTIELHPATNFGGFDTTAMAPTLVNGKVYFTGTIQGQAADDLFVTDGTAAGTHDLGTIAQGSNVSVDGNDLFFYASDPTDGPGLFAYNTTTGTKTFLHAIPQSDAFVVKVGSQIEVGTPANGPTGNNLWVTDGTTGGTTELTNLASNVALTNFTAVGADVYFSSFGGNEGFWVTNGTAAGTHEIESGISVATDSFADVGGNLFFTATDSASQTREWIYNPTTQTLTEQAAGAVTSIPQFITPVGTGAFFIANDATSQSELWHTTSTGTIVELTSPTNGELSGFAEMAVSGSNLFFAGNGGLFITNGSSVTLLAALNNLSDFSVVGSDLYFESNDPTNGNELWVSDGTAAGTHRLTDTERPGASVGSGFVTVGAKMFFAANDGVHGEELWMFNGQAGGASLVSDINPGAGGSNPTGLVALGSDVYFAANDGSGPTELWRSDGTVAGTVVVSTSTDGADPVELTVVGSELFYFGSDSAHGAGLFVTNGTAAPTFVKAFTNITDVSVSGGKLFFQGTTGSGSELWVSNGTAAGTVQLSSTGVNPGSNPSDLTPLGGAFTPRQDFNDDSRSDFLVRNASGAVVVGEFTHGQTHLAVVSGLGSEWSFEGNADFLGDGHQDFLVENSNGAVVVGDVSNGQTTLSDVGGLGKEWTFKGVGDFLGQGKSQFLIENTAGAVVVGDVVNGQASYTQVSGLGPEWKFVGTGDFLGDGRDDFLIQNTGGAVAIGEVLNGSAKYTVAIGLGSEWKFVGAGDFLGDGHDQFLIENTSGAVLVGDWEGGQTHLTQVAALGAEWKFVGDGDFLGEGHDQFLIENTSGAVVVGDWLNGQIHFTQITGLGPEWTFH